MKGEGIPSVLYRVHANGSYPLESSSRSGALRWDDRSVEASRRFHVLYTGDSVEGCFIEKLQVFSSDDDDAHALVRAVVEDEADPVPPPCENVVPAPVLRGLAVSALQVIDPIQAVLDPFERSVISEARKSLRKVGLQVPSFLQPGQNFSNTYEYSQYLSTIIYTISGAAGIVSRSLLDNPRSGIIHTCYALYRALPEDGGAPRLPLRRIRSNGAMPMYTEALRRAFEHLQVTPEISLDHPDIVGR